MAKGLSTLNDMLDKFNKSMDGTFIHTAIEVPNCKKILSSVPAYNYVTDGGFPIGRVIEHYGENGSLKSYMAYDAIGKFQHYDWANDVQDAFRSFEYTGDGAYRELKSYRLQRGYKPKDEPLARRVALVDLEGTYTPDWGENFNIDNEGLILVRPELLTQAVDIVQALLRDESISLVVFDSLSAVGTDDEMEDEMGKQQMGTAARFWNKAFRKFQASINANPTGEATLLVINSAYQKVGVMYGNPEAVRNGEQLKRTKTLSVRFQALKEIEGKTDYGDLVVGRNVVIKCMKNKAGKPNRKATLFYGYEDSEYAEQYKTNVDKQIIELALEFGFVDRRGAYYSYGDIRVQGIDKFTKELKESGDIKNLEDKIYKTM